MDITADGPVYSLTIDAEPGPPIEPLGGLVMVRDEHGRIPLGCAHSLRCAGSHIAGTVDIRAATPDWFTDVHALLDDAAPRLAAVMDVSRNPKTGARRRVLVELRRASGEQPNSGSLTLLTRTGARTFTDHRNSLPPANPAPPPAAPAPAPAPEPPQPTRHRGGWLLAEPNIARYVDGQRVPDRNRR